MKKKLKKYDVFRRNVKQNSRLILSLGSVRINLSLGIIISMTFVLLPVLIAGNIASILRAGSMEKNIALIASACLSALLIAPPFFCGIGYMARHAVKNRDVTIFDLFRFFCGIKKYLRSLGFFAVFVLPKVAVFASALCGAGMFRFFMLGDGNGAAIARPLKVLIVILVYMFSIFAAKAVVSVFVRDFFAFELFMAEEDEDGRTRLAPLSLLLESVRISKGMSGEILKYRFSFTGINALSFMSACALFVIHTLPYRFLTYFVYSEYKINDYKKITEDNENV